MPTQREHLSRDGFLGLERLDHKDAELLWGVGWEEDHFSSAVLRVRERPCFAEVLPEQVALGRPTEAWRQYLVIELTPEQFAEEQERGLVTNPAVPDLTADPSERRNQIRAHFAQREQYGKLSRSYRDNEVLGWLDGLPGTGLRRIIPRDSVTVPGETPSSDAGGCPRSVPNRSRARWIYDDVFADPDDPQYYEIIDGLLIPHLGHSIPHQEVLGELIVALDRVVDDLRLGLAIHGPLDIPLPDGDVLQPDLMAFLQPRREAGKRGTVPDLVVEVIDATTRSQDLGRKWQRYAEIGVREYWAVDIEERTIGVVGLRGRRYVDLDQDPNQARSVIVPGFAVASAELFAVLDRLDWD
jgi:Uma2 family endonuclease